MKNSKYSKLFVVAITELAMMLISLKVIGKIFHIVIKLFDGNAYLELISDCILLSLFIIPILICLIYMKITYPSKLKVFTYGGTKKCLTTLGYGLAIGFFLNSALCIITLLSGSIEFSFQKMSYQLLFLIIPCFIQCAAEEILLRGYASSYLEERYQYDVVAFVGGVLFVFHHINNLTKYGFDSFFVLNVFLVGIFLYLLMKISHSIWICFGFHTAWNFTQAYIFGVPNSGMVSALSIFKGENAVKSFFCNPVYGNEGTAMCSVLLIIGMLILLYIHKKQKSIYSDNLTPYSY